MGCQFERMKECTRGGENEMDRNGETERRREKAIRKRRKWVRLMEVMGKMERPDIEDCEGQREEKGNWGDDVQRREKKKRQRGGWRLFHKQVITLSLCIFLSVFAFRPPATLRNYTVKDLVFHLISFSFQGPSSAFKHLWKCFYFKSCLTSPFDCVLHVAVTYWKISRHYVNVKTLWEKHDLGLFK